MIHLKEWNKEWWKLPVILIISGIFMRVINYVVIYSIGGGKSEWTFQMGDTVFYINFIVSLIVFFMIGFIFCRRISKKVLIKSAHILLAYHIVIFALGEVLEKTGIYVVYMNLLFLYLPFEIFNFLVPLMVRAWGSAGSMLIFVIPTFFVPYLFVLFGKKEDFIE